MLATLKIFVVACILLAGVSIAIGQSFSELEQKYNVSMEDMLKMHESTKCEQLLNATVKRTAFMDCVKELYRNPDAKDDSSFEWLKKVKNFTMSMKEAWLPVYSKKVATAKKYYLYEKFQNMKKEFGFKCIAACVAKKFGVMRENGILERSIVVPKMYNSIKGSGATIQDAEGIVEKCLKNSKVDLEAAVIDPDDIEEERNRCESFGNFRFCVTALSFKTCQESSA